MRCIIIHNKLKQNKNRYTYRKTYNKHKNEKIKFNTCILMTAYLDENN